jgi:protein tyrosine phosphatase (PTP) superfamily phosphohydrolase (DUF442 family)
LLLTTPLVLTAETTTQVPFGDKISGKVFNYHRHTPTIATSGSLADGAVMELKGHGFRSVLDLRTRPEGVDTESGLVRRAQMTYLNLPVGKNWPDDELFRRFGQFVENQDNHPILIHCASANRVGMIWAAYRLQQGADYDTALTEGRTIGMKPSREAQLKQMLGADNQPPVRQD